MKRDLILVANASHDRLGNGSQDSHPGGVSFEPRLDPRRKHHLEFARILAARVEVAVDLSPPKAG